MNCIVDLFDKRNPYGCCNVDSCLYNLWFIPLVTITSPIWLPLMLTIWVPLTLINECYQTIGDSINWSNNKHNHNIIII